MSPALIQEQRLTIRQSHLRHLEEHCPALAWALSVEAREGPERPEALRGRAVHAFFSGYAQHLYQTGRDSDPGRLPALLGEVFRAYPTLRLAQREDVTSQAEKIAAGFSLDREHFYGAEEALAVHLGLSGGRNVTLTGRLDYLELHAPQRKAVIVDLKSSYHLPPDSRVMEDFQLACYALLVFDNFPQVEVVEGRLLFSRYGVRLPQKGGALWTREDAEHLKAHLRTRLAAHFAGELRQEYVPGDHCRYCPRHRVGDCPLFRSYYGPTPPPPRSERQARKLACQVLALEGARETRLALLKEYVKTRGLLAVGSGPGCEVFAFREKEQEEIEAADFISVLHESGIELSGEEISELFSLDRTSKLYKKLLGRADLKDGLARVTKRRTSSSVFGHRRPI